MSNRKKKSNILKGALVIVAILLVMELGLVVWLEKKQDERPVAGEINAAATTLPDETAAPTESAATETTEPETAIPETTVPETDGSAVTPETPVVIVACENDQIQTPYFPLYYPDALADLLVVANTADEPFTLEFYAMLEDRPEQRIFDIRLSERVKGNLGVVKGNTGDVYVDVTFYQFNPDNSWTDNEIHTIHAMQEAINEMIGQLDLEKDPSTQKPPAVEETAPESSVSNMLSVTNPHCTLQFPVRWKDFLVTEQTENEETGVYSVLFYGKLPGRERCLMFTILFGGDEGEQLGVVLNDLGEYVTVNILIADMNLDGWSQEDTQIICSMQEAVNELIDQLPLE